MLSWKQSQCLISYGHIWFVSWSFCYEFAKALFLAGFARIEQIGSQPIIPWTDNSLTESTS